MNRWFSDLLSLQSARLPRPDLDEFERTTNSLDTMNQLVVNGYGDFSAYPNPK